MGYRCRHAKLFEQPENSDDALSTNILRNLVDTKAHVELKKYLRMCLRNEMHEITPTWHPLGFVHSKLADNTCGETYRLHLWFANKKAMQPQEHKIHDHLFDVESIVLKGSVVSNEYDLAPVKLNSLITHRTLRVNYAKNGPILYEDGATGQIVKKEQCTVNEGASYQIKRTVLHESSIYSSEIAITLVRTSNPLITYNPRIVVPIDSALPPFRQPILFSKEDWLEILESHLD